MVDRVIIGQRGGSYGAWVSKPGYDVNSANLMQMAFSSDLPHPRLIAKGTVFIPPSGNAETIARVGYGADYGVPPFVAAIGNASDWTFAFGSNSTKLTIINPWPQFSGQWITPISERVGLGTTNIYHFGGSKTVSRFGAASSNNVLYDQTWASGKFLIRPNTSYVDFVGRCSAGITVKYIVYDYSR